MTLETELIHSSWQQYKQFKGGKFYDIIIAYVIYFLVVRVFWRVLSTFFSYTTVCYAYVSIFQNIGVLDAINQHNFSIKLHFNFFCLLEEFRIEYKFTSWEYDFNGVKKLDVLGIRVSCWNWCILMWKS